MLLAPETHRSSSVAHFARSVHRAERGTDPVSQGDSLNIIIFKECFYSQQSPIFHLFFLCLRSNQLDN